MSQFPTQTPLSVVGQGLVRTDGHAKVTGAALYVDDVRPEGCLHGATVRSTVAHARVTRIALHPEDAAAGVVLVTADDIPGENVVALMTDDQPALASTYVKHEIGRAHV